MSEACFTAADILLPAAGVPLDPWACIAVDQFTSQPEYWQRAEHLADGKPSTLHIVLPEAYLGTPQEAERLESIRRTMEEYRKSVLTRKVHGYVYVERTQMDGTVRQGLVGAVDLDAYDYAKGSKPAIRPSESTVVERIPPRLKVRRGATLETPHVMMLADDSATTDTAASADLLSQIRERGTITVAMEGTWAPWTYHDENDNLVGYDVEVATLIAEKLGVEPEFIEGEWDGLLAGLDAGRYDIMVNGVDITPERAEKYDFSTPYAFNRTAVITKADDDSINTLEDLKGKKTANTISSTYAELAEQYGATVMGVDDLNQTFELLLSGRIDATLNAEMTFYDYTKEHPDANVKIAVLTDDANQIAIPMRKGDETATLRTAIDAAIDELRADGTLKALSEKYFGRDISTEE